MSKSDAANGVAKNGVTNATNGKEKNVKNGKKNGATIPSRASEVRLMVPLSAILPSPDKVGADGKFHAQETKLAALRHSGETLGDWTEAIHCVPGPKPNTYYQWEQHHRVIWLREVYGPEHKVPIVVDSLTPQMRLRRTVESNGEAYGFTPSDHAEAAQATVRQIAQDLPGMIARGEIPAIEEGASAYYDARGKNPFEAKRREKDEVLPPYAYTSGMASAYSGINDRTLQRAFVLLNGLSRVKIAPADVVDGLTRDESEAIGRVAAKMTDVKEGAVTPKERDALRRVGEELKRMRETGEGGVLIAGKEVNVLAVDKATDVATAIRAGNEEEGIGFAEEREEEEEATTPGVSKKKTHAQTRALRVRNIIKAIATAKERTESARKGKAKLEEKDLERIEKQVRALLDVVTARVVDVTPGGKGRGRKPRNVSK